MTHHTTCVEDALKSAAARLREAGVDNPLLDAQLLIARVLGCSRTDLIAHPERVLTADESSEYAAMVAKRAARCPLAYILGRREFCGLEITVSPGVLIPRLETEILVEECLKRVAPDSPVIADIGTGSGAVAIALAAHIPSATLYATEISPRALEVARANIEKHDLSRRVRLVEGDLARPLEGLGVVFDAVVSNPPYIPTGEISALQPEISRHEPVEALDGGPDGLEAYRRLLPESIGLLAAGGFTAVEGGAGQAGAVRAIAEAAGYNSFETARDLAGIERVVVAYR